jgi:hypothetical protein
MDVERLVELKLAVETQALKKICHSTTFSITNPTWLDLVLNLGHHDLSQQLTTLVTVQPITFEITKSYKIY